jgi:uncharacterized protein (DUF2252 family)
VAAYREAMAGFAQMGTLAIWYAHLSEDELVHAIRSAAAEASKPKKAAKAATGAEKRVQKITGKARTRDSLQTLSKLGEVSGATLERAVHEPFRAYRAGLREDQRQLLERFELVDVARKVVGVGSVGTRAFIGLLQGRDQQDPLVLQVKEATASVLEGPLPNSHHRQHSEGRVAGQRMMQAASDIFLGWTKGADRSRHYYWRQLRPYRNRAAGLLPWTAWQGRKAMIGAARTARSRRARAALRHPAGIHPQEVVSAHRAADSVAKPVPNA